MKVELLQAAVKKAELGVEDSKREAELNVQRLELLNSERLATIKRLCGKLGGRPQVSRSEEELENCSVSTAWHCQESMTRRVAAAIGVVGTDSEITTVALMEAINQGGYLEAVWESELMWGERLPWLKEMRADLAMSWSAKLSMDIRDKLLVSYDKMDELRFMLSHHRVGKQLRPRTWAINPWNGERVSYPEPIRPRSGTFGWTRLVSAAQERYGLTMDKAGRMAKRSFQKMVGLQFLRDEARGILREITDIEPLVCVQRARC